MRLSGRRGLRRTAAIILAGALALIVAPDRPATAAPNLLKGPSPFVGFRHYIANPAAAPAELRAQFTGTMFKSTVAMVAGHRRAFDLGAVPAARPEQRLRRAGDPHDLVRSSRGPDPG